MEWTREQDRALKAVSHWFHKTKTKSFYLAGYAGTGKTTLASEFTKSIKKPLYAAFTGKAASVLRAKGCPNACTVHSMLYRPKQREEDEETKDLRNLIEAEEKRGEVSKEKLEEWKLELERLVKERQPFWEVQGYPETMDAGIVVVDECSMIGEKMGQDIENNSQRVLWLGDPGQLPPVQAAPFLSRKPDAILEEIHRQAADSPILTLATMVRKGETIKFGTMGDSVRILPKKEFSWEDCEAAGQVICGKNETRHKTIRTLRRRAGFNLLYPIAGDKLICLRNNHEKGYLNGVTCRTIDSRIIGGTVELDIEYEGQKRTELVEPGHFQESYQKRSSWLNPDSVEHFGYGNCITGHKSQGSQWDSVCVLDDKMRIADRSMRRKWLYTVVTRAAKELLIYV